VRDVTPSFCRRPFVRIAICALAALVLDATILGASRPAFAHEGETLTSAPPPGSPSPFLPATNVSPSETRHKVWPWVFIGVGALTLGTGIWLVHKDDTDASMPMCTTSPIARTTCPYSTATQWQGWAVVAIGAQLAALGIVWEVFQVRRARKSVSLAAGPGGLVGTF
jgi:hypothetical protein